MANKTFIKIAPGPFRRDGFKILDANGRVTATISISIRIPTAALESTGDLLASSWTLREHLRHVLVCSGSPNDCDDCKSAAELVREVLL